MDADGPKPVAWVKFGVDGSEGRTDEKTHACADGEVAAPVVIVLEQCHARADGEACDATIDRVGSDDGGWVPVGLNLDDFGAEGVGTLATILRSGCERRSGEQRAEHGDEQFLHCFSLADEGHPLESCDAPAPPGNRTCKADGACWLAR